MIEIRSDSLPGGPSKEENSCRSRSWLILTVAILIIHYGMSFGIEISVNTVLNLYLLYKFKRPGCTTDDIQVNVSSFNTSIIGEPYNVTTMEPISVYGNECSTLDVTTASLITSLFGLMNLFSRALGGFFSDFLRSRYSIPGRIIAHYICILSVGTMLIVFSLVESVSVAIFVIVIFSLFVQMTEGTVYAMVPYISSTRIGIVSGLVGAGGNAGSLIWNTIWSAMVEHEPSQWFWTLGIIIICFSNLSFLITIQGKKLFHVCHRNK